MKEGRKEEGWGGRERTKENSSPQLLVIWGKLSVQSPGSQGPPCLK